MNTPPKPTTFRVLKDALGEIVKPALLSLDFKPYHSKRAHFPERYYRERPGRIDVVRFHFDKHARPLFRIEFRPIEDSEDLALIAKDPNAMWDWFSYYHLDPSRRPGAWHKVDLVTRLLAPRWGARKIADRVADLIPAMDAFLDGGPPTPNISERFLLTPQLRDVGRKPPLRRIGR